MLIKCLAHGVESLSTSVVWTPLNRQRSQLPASNKTTSWRWKRCSVRRSTMRRTRSTKRRKRSINNKSQPPYIAWCKSNRSGRGPSSISKTTTSSLLRSNPAANIPTPPSSNARLPPKPPSSSSKLPPSSSPNAAASSQTLPPLHPRRCKPPTTISSTSVQIKFRLENSVKKQNWSRLT